MRFAVLADRSEDLQALRQDACETAADGLNAGFSRLLIHDDLAQDLRPVAGTGWQAGAAGRSRPSCGLDTPAGLAWRTGRPVVSDDLGSDRRFRVPDLVVEHGLRSSLSVPLVSGDQALGVLEVGTARPARFLAADASYLQLIALSLVAAGPRLRTQGSPAPDTGGSGISSQELEHRIRNDLQGIYASIEREAVLLPDPLQRAGYDRVNRHVLAIASLYQHLRVGETEPQVELGCYMATLCARISGAGDLSARGITLTAGVQPVQIASRKAGPLGIAVNELIANAAEHAFPDRRQGKVDLRVATMREGDIERLDIIVSDDGCGFTEGRPGRAGLGLASRLVQATGGTLVRVQGVGTTWRITLRTDAAALSPDARRHGRG